MLTSRPELPAPERKNTASKIFQNPDLVWYLTQFLTIRECFVTLTKVSSQFRKAVHNLPAEKIKSLVLIAFYGAQKKSAHSHELQFQLQTRSGRWLEKQVPVSVYEQIKASPTLSSKIVTSHSAGAVGPGITWDTEREYIPLQTLDYTLFEELFKLKAMDKHFGKFAKRSPVLASFALKLFPANISENEKRVRGKRSIERMFTKDTVAETAEKIPAFKPH